MEITNLSPPSNLPKVLLLHPPPAFTHFETEFNRHFHFLKANTSSLPLPTFLAAANSAGVTAMLAGGHNLINAGEILDHLPQLRCITTTTAGLNYIDVAECRRRGIAIASAGDAYSDDCADCAVGLLIDVMRKVSAGDRFVRRGDWAVKGHYCLGHQFAR
ncbi:Glyoxylate/hydroxypyruvate reductase HPR3 [Bienertia sinuspersici]